MTKIQNNKGKNDGIAIDVENVSKAFKIPHEKHTTLKQAALSAFRPLSYEKLQALDSVSFDVKKGEFFGIIGHNGSGKSTLLKILAGIYMPDKGDIFISGKLSPFLELGVGFNPELTARENIFLGGAVLGLSRKEIEEKFDEIVRFAELEEFIDLKFKNFSSGMQVRLAFALSIHAHADILLMDEVLAVGDSNFQEKCLEVFRKLKGEGKTIVLVSHSIQTIKEFSDRVLLLDKGKIKMVGSPQRCAYEYSIIMKGRYDDDALGKKRTTVSGKSNRIVGVETINKNGESVNVIESDKEIIFKIVADIRDVSEDIFMSLAVFDKTTNVWITSNNSYYDNFKHNFKKGKNEILLHIPANIFHKGDFYVNISLFKGDSKKGDLFDFLDSREIGSFFRVMPVDQKNGLMNISHKWG